MSPLKLFSMFLKSYVVCVFCVALSQQKKVRDPSKGLVYSNFAENDNKKLNTDILQSLSVKVLAECEGKCLVNNDCVSGNYVKNKSLQGEHNCQLLATNKFTSAQQMIDDSGFQHFSVASPCDEASCENNGTCVPVYETDSYSCQCALHFEGEHCEKEKSGRFLNDLSIVGNWMAFWWYDDDTPWPADENDVLAYDFGHCKPTAPYCFGRLPLSAIEDSTEMLAVDSQGTKYKWHFHSGNSVAHAVWQALHDHQVILYGEVTSNAWTPQVLSGNPSVVADQDSFMYRDQYGVRSILLDDDNCDCKSTLNIGHGMCNDIHNAGLTPKDQSVAWMHFTTQAAVDHGRVLD